MTKCFFAARNVRGWFQILAVLAILHAASGFAGDAQSTKKITGPMMYHTYGYQYDHKSFFPEGRVKSTMEWEKENFAKYGINYFCLDGWIEGGTRHTTNGYITTHNDSWAHDYDYWAAQAHAQGLKFGVYYNPLWVHKAVHDDTNCLIEGTGVPVASLCGLTNDIAFSFYWLDVSKPGAEQYVKDYINYLRQCGVDLLKVDFLSWYESGRKSAPAHGSTNYATALRWMKEAAGDKLFISYSMPNCFNHAANEIQYGNMMRISSDVGKGGWKHISDNKRGKWQDKQPQYFNSFDGFVYWSDVSGKDGIISDGDVMRVANDANDDERRTEVSLALMAGCGIEIGDYPEIIRSNAWAYQNAELNELNAEGFVGKPLARDLTSAQSQIWKGQLPNGDWVVGLFNREEAAQERGVDFAKDLGLNGDAPVRDLWSHQDLGTMKEFKAEIPAHGCSVIKLQQPSSKHL